MVEDDHRQLHQHAALHLVVEVASFLVSLLSVACPQSTSTNPQIWPQISQMHKRQKVQWQPKDYASPVRCFFSVSSTNNKERNNNLFGGLQPHCSSKLSEGQKLQLATITIIHHPQKQWQLFTNTVFLPQDAKLNCCLVLLRNLHQCWQCKQCLLLLWR